MDTLDFATIDLVTLKKTLTSRLIDDVEAGVVDYPSRRKIATHIQKFFPVYPDAEEMKNFFMDLLNMWPSLYREDHLGQKYGQSEKPNTVSFQALDDVALQAALDELSVLTSPHATDS